MSTSSALLVELSRPVNGPLTLHGVLLHVGVFVVVDGASLRPTDAVMSAARSPAESRLAGRANALERAPLLMFVLQSFHCRVVSVLSGAVDGGQLPFLFTVSIRRLNATLNLRSRWFPQRHEFICLIQHILGFFPLQT